MASLRTGSGALLAAAFALVLAVAWWCYQPGLTGPMLLDDEVQLQPLLAAADAGTLQGDTQAFVISPTGPGGRPVAMASFIASALAHGSDLPSFKRENVLLHLLCGVLLFAWLRLLLRRGRAEAEPDAGAGADALALLAAALWLLHPLMLGTVLYTVQRMTELSTLFTLAGLLAWTLGRQAQGQGRPLAGAALLAACLLVCLPLAAFSKENGVLLLPLCAALEWTVLRGEGTPSQRRAVRALFAVLLLLPLLLALTVLLPQVAHRLLQGYLTRDFTLGERLLTESRALFLYLAEWLLPTPARLGFYHDDFEVSRSLFDPWSTALAVPGVAALAFLAVWLRPRLPLVALGLQVFLIGHVLESSVVPLELVFEHRNYLPAVGLALVMVAFPWNFLLRNELGLPWVRRGLAVGVLVLLSLVTWQRSLTWSRPDVLFPALYSEHPQSPRLAALFANRDAAAGQFDMALAALQGLRGVGAQLQRVDIACLAGRRAEVATATAGFPDLRGVMDGYAVKEAVLLVNDALEARCGLAPQHALALVDRALSLPLTQADSRQLLLLYRGHLDHALGRLADAQADLDASARIDARNPLPVLLAAQLALDDGDAARARERMAVAAKVTGPRRAEYDELYRSLQGRLSASPQ